MQRWKGLKALVHDAVDHTTRLIEEGHESVARTTMAVLNQVEPVAETARVIDDTRRTITHGVLATVRLVNRTVEKVSDAGIDAVTEVLAIPEKPDAQGVPMSSDKVGSSAWLGDAALGVINGAIGDHLQASANGLALEFSLRAGNEYLALEKEAIQRTIPQPSSRIVVFVHGLAATEWSWCLNAAEYHGDPNVNFGTLLEKDLGLSVIYARYNTGLHISQNGQSLAKLLEQLFSQWPCEVTELMLVGHSMGGLVSRSAAHYADREDLLWRKKLSKIACLGSPHHGAPLEKLGNVLTTVLTSIDLPGTKIPGKILQGRSAGIKDLRHGYLFDEDWFGHDPDRFADSRDGDTAPLQDVLYCFVSATITKDPEHPMGVLLGDLLVRVPSATAEKLQHTSFPIETQHFGGVMHHQLQNHPDVYRPLKQFLELPVEKPSVQ